MNNARRKRIAEISEQIEKVSADIDKIMGDVEEVKEEEQDYLDNMPENLHSSDRYWIADAANDNLYSALEYIESVVDNLSEVLSYLESAAE